MRLTAIEEGHLRNGMPGTIGIAGLFPADGPPFDLAWLRARTGSAGADQARTWGSLQGG